MFYYEIILCKSVKCKCTYKTSFPIVSVLYLDGINAHPINARPQNTYILPYSDIHYHIINIDIAGIYTVITVIYIFITMICIYIARRKISEQRLYLTTILTLPQCKCIDLLSKSAIDPSS